jgi:hypothetical protein
MLDDDHVVVYDTAIDPHAAQAALAQYRERARQAGELALALGATSVALGLLGGAASVAPVIVGAVVAFVMWGAAVSARTGLLARLVGQRSAYVIPDVAAAGAQLATPQERARLAESLARVLAALDRPCAGRPGPVTERAGRYVDDLRALAAALVDDRVHMHPSALVLVRGLLEWPLRSPLYNVDIPETTLRIVLGRIRAALDEPRDDPDV